MQTTDESQNTAFKNESYTIVAKTYSKIVSRIAELFQVRNRCKIWSFFDQLGKLLDTPTEAPALDDADVFSCF